MKKITIAFSLLLLLSGILPAQILISTMDMPKAEDIYPVYSTRSSGFTNFATTGANHVWDFHTLQQDSAYTVDFLKTQDSPVLYQIFYTNATIASPNSSPAKPVGFDLNLDNPYDYFIKTSNSFEYLGYCASVSGVPIPAQFSSPDTMWHLPLHFNDRDTCVTSFQLSIPNTIFFREDRERRTFVDGWGTLTIPGGTFNVLRAKVEVIRDDSVYVDSSQTGYNLPAITELEYVWLAKQKGVPILRVTGTSLFGFFIPSQIIFYAVPPTGIEIEDPDGSVFQTWPNPASEGRMQLRWDEGKHPAESIELFDYSGRLVRKVLKDAFTSPETCSFEGLPAGNYLIRLNAGDASYSRKIVVE